MFENRTDLALEERESFEGDGGEIGGVALREWRCHGSSIRMTEVSILNEKGAESMGKPTWKSSVKTFRDGWWPMKAS